MKSIELNLSEYSDVNSQLPRIGGNALLPNNFAWPKNPSGNKLTLIASIPCSWINSLLNTRFPESHCISVFSTYSRDDYFLDVITYSGDIIEHENIKNGYTQVLLHEMSDARSEAQLTIPARKILLSNEIADNSFCGSKAIGLPALVQNKLLDTEEAQFCLQLYSSDFPDEFEDIFELSDALGYLYIYDNNKVINNIAGIFFVQTT